MIEALLQIRRVKTFSKPAVHWSQQVVGVLALTLLLPELTQTQGGPQLPGFGLLAARHVEGLLEAAFCPDGLRLAQEEGALEPVDLGAQVALPAGLERRQGF